MVLLRKTLGTTELRATSTFVPRIPFGERLIYIDTGDPVGTPAPELDVTGIIFAIFSSQANHNKYLLNPKTNLSSSCVYS